MDEISTKLAVLETNAEHNLEVTQKIQQTLEKLSVISADISRIVAVHEEKLNASTTAATNNGKEISDLKDRVSSLENWRWFVLGISATFGMFFRDIIDFFKK